MAFFKFRNGADEAKGTAAPAPSIESIRQRAKYRLVGAAVLVLAGVVVIPLLLNRQPRGVAVNIPIEIPDKNKTPLLVMPPALPPTAAPSTPVVVDAPTASVASAPTSAVSEVAEIHETATPAPAEKASGSTKSETAEAAKPAARAVSAADIVGSAAASKAVPAASKTASAASKPALTKASDAARAKAMLEGANTSEDEADPAAAQGRFVVQVGAFADAARAREVRLKVERAGMKTYTHVAETKDGRRIRVRVGPFPTRAEAEDAASKIKKLDLPAALLTL